MNPINLQIITCVHAHVLSVFDYTLLKHMLMRVRVIKVRALHHVNNRFIRKTDQIF